MIDKKMQALIDAPLADPKRIYLPEGKRPTTRSAPLQYSDEIGGKVSGKAVAERKKRAASDKLVALYDYYANTDLSAEKIAQHMGVYRQEQTGVDDKGKPVLVRVLDVKTVEAQVAWRRCAASGIEARQRTDPEEGLDPKGESPTAESGDAQCQ